MAQLLNNSMAQWNVEIRKCESVKMVVSCRIEKTFRSWVSKKRLALAKI